MRLARRCFGYGWSLTSQVLRDTGLGTAGTKRANCYGAAGVQQSESAQTGHHNHEAQTSDGGSDRHDARNHRAECSVAIRLRAASEHGIDCRLADVL